ncbi:hypothetical protein [Paraburkholderia sp. BR14320]|uniref:hypothetical protein n=1 Tax=unclassified Paraburkholderia TaxID=2615204 RepID=UPI0034CF6A10
MFELSCDALPLSNFVPKGVAILFSIEDAAECRPRGMAEFIDVLDRLAMPIPRSARR